MDKNIGIIKIGRNTEKHPQRLRDLGYEVEIVDGADDRPRAIVLVNGFVEYLDLSLGNEPLRDVIKQKMALSYRTRVKFPDSSIASGLPLCFKLGALSCLVMVDPTEEPANTEADPPMTDIFKEILKMSNEILALKAEIAQLRRSRQ